MKARHYGEPATVRVRVSGKDAEDAFFPIVSALRRENRLRKQDGYAPIVYEVETERETAAGATAAAEDSAAGTAGGGIEA